MGLNFKRIIKSSLSLIMLLFVLSAGAADYSKMTLSELKNKAAELTNLKNDYEAKGNACYAQANKWISSPGTAAVAQVQLHIAQGKAYHKKALDAATELKKVNDEIKRRGNSDGGTVTSLTLSSSSSKLVVGSQVTITCKAKYSNGTTRTVTPTWSVSNTKYVSVSNGKITAKSAGVGKSVTVTASFGGKTTSKKFTIAKTATLKSLTVTASTSTLKIGSGVTLTCQAKYSDGTTKTVTPTWSFSNKKYASISGGKITAKSAGAGKSVSVTASFGGKTASKKFTIAQAATLNSLTISASSSTLKANSSVTLTCKAQYSDGSTKTVTPTWSVSHPRYASISNGKITAKTDGQGKQIYVIASYNGKNTRKAFNIAQAPTVQSLTISSSSSKLQINSGIYLTCKAKYSDGTTKTVTPSWSVSNSKYASLSGSKITAKSAGGGKSVTVTASFGGKNVKKTFNIIKPATLKSITISLSSTRIRPGASTYVTCKARYSDGTTKTVTPSISVSPNKYVFVNGNKITARLVGNKGKTFKVTASYGGKTDTKTVSISK